MKNISKDFLSDKRFFHVESIFIFTLEKLKKINRESRFVLEEDMSFQLIESSTPNQIVA